MMREYRLYEMLVMGAIFACILLLAVVVIAS